MGMAAVICSTGCGKPVHSRGWCAAHYSRWRLYGDPLGSAPPPPPCAVEGCEGKHKAYGYCKPHYRRWLKYGDPLAGPPRRGEATADGRCGIEGCERPHEAKGLCATHYTRWSRHGDTYVDKPIRLTSYNGAECGVDGCGRAPHARGWCSMHYARWQTYGDPLTVAYIPGTGDDISYSGAHCRIYRERGKASEYMCPCGEPAQEWSYGYACPRERTERVADTRNGARAKARDVPYSPDPWAYDALCISCHYARDQGRASAPHCDARKLVSDRGTGRRTIVG